MRADKVREIDSKELNNQLMDSEEQMFRIRFQMSMGQTDGLKKYRELRKDRARMLTILHERAANPEANPEPAAKPARKKGKK
jgi:large subunit ribosomal protein L29